MVRGGKIAALSSPYFTAIDRILERQFRGQSQDKFHLPAVRGREPGVPRAMPRVWRLEFDD
jgi:hypothetical protein